MHYEITISLNGRHLFATAPRSCTNKFELKRAYDHISRKFPSSEGYGLSVSSWQTTGTSVLPSEFMEY